MNKTVVNASGDVHYEKNKENLHVSVHILSTHTKKSIQMNKTLSVLIFS